MPMLTPRIHLARVADRLRSSLWLIPGGLILLAAAAAFGTIALDRGLEASASRPWWAFQAGAPGARATLSAIASSVMTVAGLAFSITIVVLQLSSSQFSPRVVRNFLRDRFIQVVLGAYMGTFTFALLVLRTVASDEGTHPAFVAPTGVTVATALALLCMMLLVAFIHHVAQAIQVSAIIGSVARETRAAIEHLYPEGLGEPAEESAPPLPSGPSWPVRAPRGGYLDYIDESALDELPEGAVVQIAVNVGDYAREGDVLARVWAREGGGMWKLLQRVFALEDERSMQQDVRFGVCMIADVALRAVSPGINDPTTAAYCINVLGDLLCRLATRAWPAAVRRRPERGLTVHVARPSFGDIVDLAFAQVLRYGKDDPHVVGAVASALGAIAARGRDSEREEVVRELAGCVATIVRGASWPERDRERVLAPVRALLTAPPKAS